MKELVTHAIKHAHHITERTNITNKKKYILSLSHTHSEHS